MTPHFFYTKIQIVGTPVNFTQHMLTIPCCVVQNWHLQIRTFKLLRCRCCDNRILPTTHDDRPIVDSGNVVSTCPVDYATSVPTEKVHDSMSIESVLGESLQLYGITRNVPFTKRIGSVNCDVTDTKRAILSVHEGCGNGSMIVFAPDGKGKIVNDTKCIEQVKLIMAHQDLMTLCTTEEPTYWT